MKAFVCLFLKKEYGIVILSCCSKLFTINLHNSKIIVLYNNIVIPRHWVAIQFVSSRQGVCEINDLVDTFLLSVFIIIIFFSYITSRNV